MLTKNQVYNIVVNGVEILCPDGSRAPYPSFDEEKIIIDYKNQKLILIVEPSPCIDDGWYGEVELKFSDLNKNWWIKE